MVNNRLQKAASRKLLAALHKQLAFAGVHDHMASKRMRRADVTAAVLAA
jgi:hypothetical protein